MEKYKTALGWPLCGFISRYAKKTAFLFMLFFPLLSLGQHHAYQKFGVSDGLSTYRASQLLQDDLGRILVGTIDGLNVFDGYRFKNYSQGSNSMIYAMTQDQEGGLWYVSSHLEIFHFSNGKLSPHPANDSLARVYNNRKSLISSFSFIAGDTLVMGFHGAGYQLKIAADGTVKKVSKDKTAIYLCDTASSLFFGYFKKPGYATTKTVILNGQKLEIEEIDCYGKLIAAKGVHGEIVFTLGASLYVLAENKIVKQYTIEKNPISLKVAKNGDLWIGFKDGVEHRTPDGSSVIEYLLPNEFCSDILEDEEGNMWFATTKGLLKMLGRDVRHYSETDNGPIAQQFQPHIYSHQQSIYVVSNMGVFTLEGDSFIKKNLISRRERTKPIPENFHFMNNRGVLQINGDSSGYITPLEHRHLSLLFEEDGSYWSTRGFDLVYFDAKGNEVFDSKKAGFEIEKNKLDLFPFGRVHCKDSKGRIWASLGAGLYYYFQDSITLFQKSCEDFSLVRVNKMLEAQGVLWASTLENGLWAIYGDSTYHIGTENHLFTDKCRAFVQESDSVLWLATIKGLYRIEFYVKEGHLKYQVQILNEANGLLSTYVERAAFGSDRLWISSESGVTAINTKTLGTRNVPGPCIQLTRVRVGNEVRETATLASLTHQENNIGIDFIGITYLGDKRPTYAYRMLGSDSVWHTSADTSIQFSGLAPGDYQFQVRTINTAGLASYIPASLAISISKPYWQEWWFILAIIIGVQLVTASVLLTLTRLRRRTLLSEKNTLIAELKALRLQVNPHFMFNALNNIREMVNEGGSNQAPQQLLHFSQLMRKILNASRKETISLADEVDLIRSYLALAEARFQDRVTYNVEVSDEVMDIDEVVNIPPLITQPLIENALIHGASKALSGGHIDVLIDKVEDYIRCQIIDNGPGFESGNSSSAHASIGMSLIHDQIEKLNATRKRKIRFQIKSGADWNLENGGTCVQLEVPMDL